MAIAESNVEATPELRTKKEPRKATPTTIGGMAVQDAVLLVLGAWALLFFLAWSLRHHNV